MSHAAAAAAARSSRCIEELLRMWQLKRPIHYL